MNVSHPRLNLGFPPLQNGCSFSVFKFNEDKKLPSNFQTRSLEAIPDASFTLIIPRSRPSNQSLGLFCFTHHVVSPQWPTLADLYCHHSALVISCLDPCCSLLTTLRVHCGLSNPFSTLRHFLKMHIFSGHCKPSKPMPPSLQCLVVGPPLPLQLLLSHAPRHALHGRPAASLFLKRVHCRDWHLLVALPVPCLSPLSLPTSA